MTRPGAREYVYTQQVALPTGGYARAGSRIWLTDHEFTWLDPGLRSVLVDVARAAELERIKREHDEARRAAGLADGEAASSEVVDQLRGRRARKRRRITLYADKMIHDAEDK